MLPEWLLEPPGSTIFILCISMLVMFITSLSNRVLVNQEQMRAWKREIDKMKREIDKMQQMKKAKGTDDKKLLERVRRKQLEMMRLQSKISWQSMKVMPISFICAIVVWYLLLIPSYGGNAVAYLPGLPRVDAAVNLPILGKIPSLLWWYALCSMLFSSVFSRLFGTGMGATE